MTDGEILRSVGLGTLLDNVDNNLIGRWVLKAMAQARQNEREACAVACDNVAANYNSERWLIAARDCADAVRMRSNAEVSGAGTASA